MFRCDHLPAVSALRVHRRSSDLGKISQDPLERSFECTESFFEVALSFHSNPAICGLWINHGMVDVDVRSIMSLSSREVFQVLP